MKKMVKLAVLMVTLLLFAGVAFANNCHTFCYDVTVQEVGNPTNTHNACVPLQLCLEDNSGQIYLPSPYNGNLSLFFDAMNEEALGFPSEQQTDGFACVAYVKFHGDWFHIMNGIGFCMDERHEIKGIKIDCDDPKCPAG